MSRICSWQIEHTSFFIHANQQKTKTLIRLPKHYFCISRCNNFSLFNLLQPSFFIFFFLSFLISVFWFEKWINRDWGREKRKNFALCFVSIITCTLRFKIDCSYQNGIRDYVYISQPHSTAPHRRIEFYYYFFLPFIGLIVRFASFERQFIYAYIKILLSFKSVKCATNFYSIAIRAFIVTAKCKSHMVYGSWFQLLCRAIQFFYATHVIYLKTATITTTTTIEWRK